MRKESFLAAQNDIEAYFKHGTAYTTHDIAALFEKNREGWGIASYRNYLHFMAFLNEKNILITERLKHTATGSLKQVLAKPGISKHYIAQTIKKDGHLSNYTAMQIHQLTLQIPKTVYISYDKYATALYDSEQRELEQSAVDNAFSKPQRLTSEVYRSEKDNTRYFFIQKKMDANHTGIVEKDGLSYTDLERTLLDCAIRPAYSGGVLEVLEAFVKAKKKVDAEKLESYLAGLDYIYPYYQLIGFYMERAGYGKKELQPFLERRSGLDFYLTYNMSNKLFDEKWKMYYPKGF